MSNLIVASVLRSTELLFNLAPRSLNGKHNTTNARKIKETLLKQKRQFYLFVCLFLVTQETGIFKKKNS